METEIAYVGAPSKYKPEYIGKVDEYLSQCADTIEERVIKIDESGQKSYMVQQVVNLPTIEDFCLFINVPERTLYDWKKQGDDYSDLPDEHKNIVEKKEEMESKMNFSQSLRKIITEQKKRLMNKGLSGDYNSTIAKLILSANHDMREKSDTTSDGKSIAPPQEIKWVIIDGEKHNGE